jgi:hypothetical protein
MPRGEIRKSRIKISRLCIFNKPNMLCAKIICDMIKCVPEVGKASELVGSDDAAAKEGTVRHPGALHQQRLRAVNLQTDKTL